MIFVGACSSDSSSSSSSSSSTTTACDGATIAASDICTTWQLNTTGETSTNLRDEATGLTAPEVNVQSVTASAAEDFVTVAATDIPNYVRTVTADDITYFGTFAATDFADGVAETVVAGDSVEFGGDVGFATLAVKTCWNTVGGKEWWPMFGNCPSEQSISVVFPVTPVVRVQPASPAKM